MLSQKTQNYLCELLFEIAKGEKQVEVVRQLLGEQDTFEPYSAFKRIDSQRKKFINSYDIKDFLGENGFPHSLQECDLFIKAYDIDQDTKISYTEFLRVVLPYDNQSLRESVSQRPPLEIKNNEKLSCDVEYTLSKLIDREIKCNLAIIEKKSLLETRYDFSVADCFNTLDANGKKVLDGRDFYAFFRKNGLVSYEDEIVSLNRRLDFDQDGYISYEDFFRSISKQETLEKAERRNPHEHQIIASPYRKASRSPLPDRRQFNVSQQMTPGSNLKEVKQSLQSSQKKNVHILSPSRRNNYSNVTSEFQTSPLRDNSRLRNSTGFKHSPAKSILKNSSHKMELEKSLLRNELQFSKEIEQINSQYASRNSDYKDDPSQVLRNRIRDSSKEVRSDPNWLSRDTFDKERVFQEEKEKLIREEQDQKIRQDTEKLIRQENEKFIREEKLRTIDLEDRERRQRDKDEYEYQIQKMKAAEKEQQMKYIERENQMKQSQILREKELQRLKTENELKQKEKERYQKQIENERKLAREQAEQFDREYEEKQRKILQLEKEKRLQELEREKRQQQMEKIKQQQEKEERDRKLAEEEKAIREQIEYERYLKQKLEDEKRYASIEKNLERNRASRPASYITSIDKTMSSYKQPLPQTTSYSHKKTATFAERSPVNQYSTPKRYDDDDRNKLSQSLSSNFRNSQAPYERTQPEREVFNKTIERSPYQRQPYEQTNKFEKQSFTSPIDLRETSKNSKVPSRNIQTATKDRTIDNENLYNKPLYSTSQKQPLTNSNNRSRLNNTQIEEQLITNFLDIIQTEKRSERARQDLALRPDFKLGDIYRVLDKTQKGFVSSLNLEELLRKLDISPTMNDIYLLMRRYDLDNDGQLRFTDITEAITPKQSEYAKLLNKRESYLDGEIQIEEVYSFETLNLLKELFKTLIESEQTLESIRSQLKQSRNFSFQDAFGLIDIDQDGFIHQHELQGFFEKNNVYCSDKEIKSLIQRFDLDRDNKISFGEFVQELSPKSNKVY